MSDELHSLFLEAVDPRRRDEAVALGAVAPMLLACAASARAPWQGAVSDEEFIVYMAERLPAARTLAEGLAGVRAADLYLAACCAQGQTEAVVELERQHGRALARTLASIRDATLLPDDLLQIVRQRLFVASHDRPALITRFAGQGKLGAWLRVTAKRLALNAVRDGGHRLKLEDDDALLRIPDAAEDVELDLLRRRYQGAFRDAFRDAVARLPERSRTLIRLSVVEGLSVRALGRMYGAHAATAARWLVRARRDLVELTIEELSGRIPVAEHELDSVLDMVRSRIDLSVVRLLGG